MKKILLISALVFAAHAQAGLVNLNFDPTACFGQTGSAPICTQIKAELETELNKVSPSVSISKYAKGNANAGALAGKTNKSDYADNFSLFVLNVGAGVAVSGTTNISDTSTAEGIGIQGGATLGLNMGILPIEKIGPIELDRLDIFVNFMGIDKKSTDKKTTTDAKLSQMGITARYLLVEGVDFVPGYLVQWGGLSVHAGLYTSKMKLSVTTTLDDVTSTVSGQTASTADSTATFVIDSDTMAIPLEVSTFIRLGYVMTFFGGVGVDLNVSGSSKVGASSSGTMKIGGQQVATFSTDASQASATEKADMLHMRAFLGAQFNIPFVRVYVKAQKEFASNSMGVNAGLKILF